MRKIKMSWYTSPNPGNFGDILTPFIFKKYEYNVEFVPSRKIQTADAISVGSIASKAGKGTAVLGSGIIKNTDKVNPEAKWIWVRGPLTRDKVLQCGGVCPELYGDPALLLPRLWNKNKEKKYKTGILPHYVDRAIVLEEYRDKGDTVINILNSDITVVVNLVQECERIITSSLHGLIVSHAYGIPAAWVKFSDKVIGGNTKFNDYLLSVGLEPDLNSTIEDPYFIEPGSINTDEIHNILKEGKFL